jgi:hypothetical protein
LKNGLDNTPKWAFIYVWKMKSYTWDVKQKETFLFAAELLEVTKR